MMLLGLRKWRTCLDEKENGVDEGRRNRVRVNEVKVSLKKCVW